MFRHHWSRLSTILLAGQALAVLASLLLVLSLDPFTPHPWSQLLPAIVGTTALTLVGFYFSDIFDLRRLRSTDSTPRKSRLALGVAMLGLAGVLSHLAFDIGFAAVVVHLALSVGFAALLQTRGAELLRRRGLATRFLLFGAGPEAGELAAEILARDPHGSEIAAFVVEDGAAPGTAGLTIASHLVPIVTEAQLDDLIDRTRTTRVLVMGFGSGDELSAHRLLRWREQGVRVESAADFRERLLGRVDPASVGPDWMVSTRGSAPSWKRDALKRGFDIVAATAILAVGAPLCLLVAALIKLEDGGPVLYRQVRMGAAGSRFTLRKLRSMRVNAESESGPLWALEDDPRVTRVGRLIRALRIDEIPQAWNILVGEMSVIGPRPERPEFEELLNASIPHYDFRHAVRPGLSGWAQIHLPHAGTLAHSRLKFEYDLYYIRHASLLIDLVILLRSAKIILRQLESYSLRGFAARGET